MKEVKRESLVHMTQDTKVKSSTSKSSFSRWSWYCQRAWTMTPVLRISATRRTVSHSCCRYFCNTHRKWSQTRQSLSSVDILERKKNLSLFWALAKTHTNSDFKIKDSVLGEWTEMQLNSWNSMKERRVPPPSCCSAHLDLWVGLSGADDSLPLAVATAPRPATAGPQRERRSLHTHTHNKTLIHKHLFVCFLNTYFEM